MASVTSLDQDMRKLRLSRYTPSTANEARSWIEDVLGRPLPPGDLLEALKDGVALCELANLVLPAPGVRYKKSAMPFVQMENISQFLRACESSPLNLPAHDRFLTVDLYESKDPAQVLQCLGAFSRQAHATNPSKFYTTIGPKKTAVVSPTTTGSGTRWQPAGFNRTQVQSSGLPSSARALSPSITGESTGSQNSTTRSPAPVSSWSTKSDQGSTAPAWNPVMYGYMGGADQAKQGVSFGARRQITSAAPNVPSFAEKERKRKEKALEEERRISELEETSQRQIAEEQEQERTAREAEERRWEEETQRAREAERIRLEQQKREWESQDQRWKEEDKRQQEERATLLPIKRPPEKPRTPSGNILRGQTLSQYQKERAAQGPETASETPEQLRVRELEKQLAEARERERQYQTERDVRMRAGEDRPARPSSTAVERPQTAQSERESEASWTADERDYSRKQLQATQDAASSKLSQTATITEAEVQPASEPKAHKETPALPARTEQITAANTSRHMPSAVRSPFARPVNRTDGFLSSNPAPQSLAPRVSAAGETGDTAKEQSSLRDQRVASQQKTQAGAWASKSLLEREMERERERQREWETSQAALKDAPRDATQGTGPGQTWDVNSYGFTAGDSQNKGSSSGSGIAMGGRRQIIGPRPQP